MKRYIAFGLSLLMLLTCIVPVSASSSSMLIVGNVEGGAGEKVIVPIALDKNSGFVSMSLSVTYDTSALTLISCEYTEVISGSVHSANYISPYVLTWENDTLTSNITSTGTIVYLTFLVSEDAEAKDYSVIVRIPTDGILDANGNTVSANSAEGKITVSEIHECSFGDWEPYSNTKHVRYCEGCDEREYKNHTWNDGEINEEPTHEEDGEIVYTCKDCGHTKSDTIDAEGHSFGEWFNFDEDEHKRSCNCGDYETEPHNWDDGEMTVEPTEEHPGEIKYTCYDCGATYTKSFEAGVHTHNYSFVKTVEPTCTKDGYSLYKCDKCEAQEKRDVTNATGHAYMTTVKSPTCLNGGYTAYYCTNCGDSYNDNYTVALGHEYENEICKRCGTSDGAGSDDPVVPGAKNVTIETNAKYYTGAARAKLEIAFNNTENTRAENLKYTVRLGSPNGELLANSSLDSLAADSVFEFYVMLDRSLENVVSIYIVLEYEIDGKSYESYAVGLVSPVNNGELVSFCVYGDWQKNNAQSHTAYCEKCTNNVTLDCWYTESSPNKCVICEMGGQVAVDGSNSDTTPTTGDINGDGKLDWSDAELYMMYLVDWNLPVNANALDVNGDGSINSKDVMRLMKYLEGFDVEIK